MRFARPEETKRRVGENLRLTRLALDLSQEALAVELGLAKEQRSTYQNWEAGVRLIDPLYAIELAEKFALSLDWIYRGQMATLSMEFIKKLAAARQVPRPAKRVRRVKKTGQVVQMPRRNGARPRQK